MTTADAHVFALEEPWRAVLDDVLRTLRAPSTADVAKLAPRLAELSRAYNQGKAGEGSAPVPLEARVAFSFARDVPKGAAAVAELVTAGLLRVPSGEGAPPLRIVDLGAGLGAMTWGVARALASAGQAGAIEALLVDVDGAALAAGASIARAARSVDRAALGLGGVELAIQTREGRIDSGAIPPLPRADLVLVGQVLSELDVPLAESAPAERAERHAAMLRSLLDTACTPEGAVVVIEPALRDRSRHLHAVRDALVGRGAGAPVLFAPCLHSGPCPALASEGDWCHEDRGVDLPPWLVPLARAAGLRYQGLTFSYLVLRREGPTLREVVARRAAEPVRDRVRLRVVSDRMPSKGKIEVFACTERGERVRLRRLDRDATEANAPFEELARGDVVDVVVREAPDAPPAALDRGRLARAAAVDVHPTRS